MKELGQKKEFHTVRGYQILDGKTKALTASMEDYLEMISRICQAEGYVRINQLADKLNVRPSSVTKVIQKLDVLGMVDYEKYEIIQLTEAGRSIGNFLLKRHEIVCQFLKNIGVDATLLRDTELIEHDVSGDTLNQLAIFNKFLVEEKDIKKRFDAFRLRIKEE